MSYPSIIFNASDSLAYELTAGNAALPQKGRYPLGTQMCQQDGRKFRYAMAGGTLLTVGDVITSAAQISTDVGMTPAAGAIGDRLITFTHGAATTIANYFSEGVAVISVTPGGGDTYKISDHLALASAVAGDVVNLSPGHALRRALTTTSRLDLMCALYAYVIQAAATTLTGAPVGVAVSPIAATTGMGWLQTRGQVGVLTSGTLIVGNRGVSGLGAGGIGPETATAATSKTQVTIGTVQGVAASGAWSSIYLQIDG